MILRPSEPLSAEHATEGFCSGQAVLDDWLKRRALANQTSGASRTFVVANEQNRVRGYYALAAGAIARQEVGGSIGRNMPDPIPVMVLARLAVDARVQGRKLGGALLRDALERSVVVSQNAGVRALIVHALDDRAKRFYEHYGFQVSPIQPMTLMLRLSKRRRVDY